VWIDKGHGRWVKKRRYHPAVKMLVAACILILGILWGLHFFHKPQTPDETETPPNVPQQPEVKISRFKMTDFPEETSYDLYPGPIPADLNVAYDEYWIRVNKSDYRLYLYRGQDVEKSYEVAVGRNPGEKERAGDNKTPTGTFTVQSIDDSRSWTHDFGDGKGRVRGAYGPWFLRLRTRWRGIGIHGTHDPNSLGSMVSEGCIRMHNYELEELRQFVSSNMKVVIEE